MNKQKWFLEALKNKKYLDKNWIIKLLSITEFVSLDKNAEQRNNVSKYDLFRDQTGVYTIIDSIDKPVKLEGTNFDEVVFKVTDKITITKDDIPNLKEKTIETTVGRLLFNYLVLVNNFGTKIEYINRNISAKELEGLVVALLVDDGVEDDTKIQVKDYIRFTNTIFELPSLADILIPGLTEKLITPPPNQLELRAKLLEENKDKLNDPATIADIEKQLIQADKDNLKGDVGLDLIRLNSKSVETVRKKLFSMIGADSGLSNTYDDKLISTSLYEGWDINKFQLMVDTLRANSFSRGAETQKGGEAAKWILRATNGLEIINGDCGSINGTYHYITQTNYTLYLNLFMLINNKPTLITEELIKSYINKTILLRSPMFCLADKTNYCETCIGQTLSKNKNALSLYVFNVTSQFLIMFLAAAHGKQLTTARLDHNKFFT